MPTKSVGSGGICESAEERRLGSGGGVWRATANELLTT
jgi:hypothetical protein